MKKKNIIKIYYEKIAADVFCNFSENKRNVGILNRTKCAIDIKILTVVQTII